MEGNKGKYNDKIQIKRKVAKLFLRGRNTNGKERNVQVKKGKKCTSQREKKIMFAPYG